MPQDAKQPGIFSRLGTGISQLLNRQSPRPERDTLIAAATESSVPPRILSRDATLAAIEAHPDVLNHLSPAERTALFKRTQAGAARPVPVDMPAIAAATPAAPVAQAEHVVAPVSARSVSHTGIPSSASVPYASGHGGSVRLDPTVQSVPATSSGAGILKVEPYGEHGTVSHIGGGKLPQGAAVEQAAAAAPAAPKVKRLRPTTEGKALDKLLGHEGRADRVMMRDARDRLKQVDPNWKGEAKAGFAHMDGHAAQLGAKPKVAHAAAFEPIPESRALVPVQAAEEVAAAEKGAGFFSKVVSHVRGKPIVYGGLAAGTAIAAAVAMSGGKKREDELDRRAEPAASQAAAR